MSRPFPTIYVDSDPFNLNSDYHDPDINSDVHSIADTVVSEREIAEEASEEGVSLDTLQDSFEINSE